MPVEKLCALLFVITEEHRSASKLKYLLLGGPVWQLMSQAVLISLPNLITTYEN
jgi:hypothetical protein